MAMPLSYNIRNLVVRRTTTIMTALGIGLTVAVLASVLALADGLRSAFTATGHPLNILVLRKGGGAELSSVMTRSTFNEVIKLRPGIAKASNGEPLASLELVSVINLPSVDAPDGENISVRGLLLPGGLEVREDAKLKEGRWFTPGRREVVIGSAIAKRYPDAKIGKKLTFGKGEWDVVGIYDSSMPARNSEIWADLNQMASDFNRFEALSSALIRAQDATAAQALINELPTDPRMESDVLPEMEYYAKQTSSGDVIRYLGTFVAAIMAIGSCFAAMNTMYAAVARRSREIGTLRILGFSQGSILLSFFYESLLLATLGGIVGLILVLPLNGLTTGIGSSVTFSQVAFQLKITPHVVINGMIFALIMGALGGFLPARNAARKQILTALRQV
jgi:putative ABC transport system permease protein